MNENQKCADCKFFYPQNIDMGFCRRFPPYVFLQPHPISGNNSVSAFAPMNPETGWCGEFKAKFLDS